MKPGQPLRFDNEYERHGTCALFLVFEPLAAKRYLQVRDRRTALDYATVAKWLCDELYPTAHKIILVQDNLNTHGPHALYQAFAPEEARRLVERIEWWSASSGTSPPSTLPGSTGPNWNFRSWLVSVYGNAWKLKTTSRAR